MSAPKNPNPNPPSRILEELYGALQQSNGKTTDEMGAGMFRKKNKPFWNSDELRSEVYERGRKTCQLHSE